MLNVRTEHCTFCLINVKKGSLNSSVSHTNSPVISMGLGEGGEVGERFSLKDSPSKRELSFSGFTQRAGTLVERLD